MKEKKTELTMLTRTALLKKELLLVVVLHY
jgi:hypothetical protein